MHRCVEHLSPSLELTCIVANATVRNVINDFTVMTKGARKRGEGEVGRDEGRGGGRREGGRKGQKARRVGSCPENSFSHYLNHGFS